MFRYISCFKSEIQTLTFDERPEVKKRPLRGQKRPLKVKMKKILPYLNFLTQKPIFRYASCYKSEIQFFTSDQRPEVKK